MTQHVGSGRLRRILHYWQMIRVMGHTTVDEIRVPQINFPYTDETGTLFELHIVVTAVHDCLRFELRLCCCSRKLLANLFRLSAKILIVIGFTNKYLKIGIIIINNNHLNICTSFK